MCIGVEILSENRLRRRSCVTKVRLTALYMHLDHRWMEDMNVDDSYCANRPTSHVLPTAAFCNVQCILWGQNGAVGQMWQRQAGKIRICTSSHKINFFPYVPLNSNRQLLPDVYSLISSSTTWVLLLILNCRTANLEVTDLARYAQFKCDWTARTPHAMQGIVASDSSVVINRHLYVVWMLGVKII